MLAGHVVYTFFFGERVKYKSAIGVKLPFKFIFQVKLTYNNVLVSGIQHRD